VAIGTEELVDLVAGGKRESSRETIRKLLAQFFRFAGKGAMEVTREDVLRFASAKRERRVLLWMTLLYLERLLRLVGRDDVAAFCRELRRGVRLPAEDEVRRGYLTREELRRLTGLLWRLAERGSAGERAAAAFFLTMLYTGCRAGEVLQLTRQDVRAGGVVVRAKGGRLAFKPVAEPRLLELLRSLPAGRGGRLFPWGLRAVEKRFKELLRRAGLPEGRVGLLRTHDLRRTAAMLLYEQTGDIVQVKDFLGHRDVKVTLRYLGEGIREVEARRLRQAAEALAGALGGGRGGEGAPAPRQT